MKKKKKGVTPNMPCSTKTPWYSIGVKKRAELKSALQNKSTCSYKIVVKKRTLTPNQLDSPKSTP